MDRSQDGPAEREAQRDSGRLPIERPASAATARVLLVTAAGDTIDVTHAADALLSRATGSGDGAPPTGAVCPPSWAALCVHLNRCTCRHCPMRADTQGVQIHPTRLAQGSAEPHHAHGPLTDRENEIVKHLRLGFTNKEIARRLGIQEDTVKKHLQSVFGKLGVRRRALVALGGAAMRAPGAS